MMFAWPDRETVTLENVQPVIGWNADGFPETPAGDFVSNTPKDCSIAVYDRIDDRILVNGYAEYVGFNELRDAFIEMLGNHCHRRVAIKW